MAMTKEMEGRVVVVTGAGRGLGHAYALDLAARGAKVIVNTRPRASGQPASADEVVERIHASGGQAAACALAVEDEGSGERLLQAALDRFGRIDALVNNAGAPEARTFHKQTLADIRSTFEINYFGSVSATLPIYRHMRENGGGRIVMTTSAAGLYGVHGMAAYSSSKAAVIALMRVIAMEGASRGVFCNAIAPFALTGMSRDYVEEDVGETMPPELVAPVVSWLASEQCTLNGETLLAGAGRVSRAVRIEGMGVRFEPAETISPQGLSAALDSVMSLGDWTMPPDGISAFSAFRTSSPNLIVR